MFLFSTLRTVTASEFDLVGTFEGLRLVKSYCQRRTGTCKYGTSSTFFRGKATSVIEVKFYEHIIVLGLKVLDTLSLNDNLNVSFIVDPLPLPAIDADDGNPAELYPG